MGVLWPPGGDSCETGGELGPESGLLPDDSTETHKILFREILATRCLKIFINRPRLVNASTELFYEYTTKHLSKNCITRTTKSIELSTHSKIKKWSIYFCYFQPHLQLFLRIISSYYTIYSTRDNSEILFGTSGKQLLPT